MIYIYMLFHFVTYYATSKAPALYELFSREHAMMNSERCSLRI